MNVLKHKGQKGKKSDKLLQSRVIKRIGSEDINKEPQIAKKKRKDSKDFHIFRFIDWHGLVPCCLNVGCSVQLHIGFRPSPTHISIFLKNTDIFPLETASVPIYMLWWFQKVIFQSNNLSPVICVFMLITAKFFI